MYELEGYEYSLEEVAKIAEESNLTVEEYIQQTGLVKKDAVAEKTANATAINEQIAAGQNMDLGSEDISLGLDKINEINQNFSKDTDGGVTTGENLLDVPQVENLELYIDNLIKTRKDSVKLQNEENSFERESVESLFNVQGGLINIPTSIKSQIQDMKASGLLLARNFLEEIPGVGKVGADTLLFSRGEGDIAYIDPETNKKIYRDSDPEEFKRLADLDKMVNSDIKKIYSESQEVVGEKLSNTWLQLMENSKKTKDEIVDVSLDFQDTDDKDKGTQFIEGFKTGDVSDIVGGAVTGVASVVSTMIPAMLTGGVSLVPQIIAPIISDYQETKANLLFPDSKDPLKELENTNQTETVIPLVLGTMAAGLEYVGFKGISKYMSTAAFNFRGLGSLILTGSKEGITEVGQLGIETTSNSIASGMKKTDAAIEGLKAMNSQKGAEAFSLGFIGAVTLGGGSAIKQRNAYRALRNDSNSVKIFNNSIKEMGDINMKIKMSKSKPYKEALKVELQQVENDLKVYLENNKKILNFLSNEQKNQLVSLIENKDGLSQQATELLIEKQEGRITNKEYGYAMRSINNQAKVIDNSIFQIRETVNLEQIESGIQNLEKVSEKFGLKVKALDSTVEYEQALDGFGFKGSKKREAMQSEGFILGDGTILINKEKAKEVGAIGVASHELLHRIIRNDLSDPVRREQIVKDFKKQLSKKELEIVQRRIDVNYKFNEDGTEKDESAYNEEYLTAFSDAVRLGEISYDQTLFEQLGNTVLKIINGKGYANASFESGRDVYNFIKEYQREFSKGKVTKRAENLSQIKPTGKIKDMSPSRSTPLEAINKLIPSSIKTDADYQSFIRNEKSAKAINDALIKPGGVINNYIRSRQTSQEQGDAMIEEALLRLFNFKPESKRADGSVVGPQGFGEAIFANTRFAKMVANKTLAIKNEKNKREKSTINKEGKTIDIVDDTTQEATEKITDTKTKTKSKISLRSKIKLSEELTDKVKKAVRKTFGTKLPPVNNPKFKTALQKAYRRDLFKDIKNMMGTRDKYQTFLGDNFADIYDALPQKTINKRFPDFFDRVLNKEGKQQREDTAQGNAKFDKKNIVKAQFIKYFNPPAINPITGKKSGKAGTRKDALAEALAEEYAFDATMEVLQEPQVLNKFKDILALQDNIVKNEIEIVSKQIDRSSTLKFSTSQLVFEKDTLKLLDLVRKGNIEDIFNEEGTLIGKYEGKFVDEARDLIWQIYQKGVIDDQKGLKYKELIYSSPDISKEVKDKFKEQGNALTSKSDINKRKNLNESNKVIAKALPSEVIDVLGTDVFGYINRVLDSAEKKVDEEATFKNKQRVAEEVSNKLKRKITVEELAKMKEGKSLTVYQKGVTGDFYQGREDFLAISKNSKVKLPEDIKLENIRLMNKKFPLFKKVSDIQASNDSNKVKLEKLEKLKPEIEAANEANIKLANYIINTIGNLYLDGKIDAVSVLNLLQLQTNAVGGIRALTTLEFLSLNLQGKLGLKKNGAYVELKGEHLAPSANSMAKLAEIILNKNKPSKELLKSEIAKVFADHTQLLTTKQLTDIIDLGGKNNPTNRDRIKFLDRKDINNIVNFEGKSYEETMVDYAIDEARQKALEKSQEKAKIFNEKILPPVIDAKFSKSTLNQEVLNEMEILDNEAQDARIKFSKSKNLNKDFNDIIERSTGIGTEKIYGKTKARAVGADKGKFDLLGIPPSAQDFVGLTRYFAGKGKKGDETIAWIKENFLDPFARANIDISNARVSLANDFKALKKLLGVSPKDLNKKITGEPYNVGNAVRVYTWVKQGMKVPGLSKADQKILEDYVTADKNLVAFANELIVINKDNGYPKPQDSWLAGTITTDLLSGLNTVVRAKYLKQWQNNVNEVFSEENMNKLEAAYGKGYREALQDILNRMKSGSNRGAMGDTLTGRFVDWLNGSVGAIMFFNMRSAVLQTISAVNFVNLSDNNILKAAAAFGNQPQYWNDVVKLMNSDYLVERRNGLKINVNEADIAEIAAESKNKAKAFINKLLKLGFLPTQIADSFAIASGGATFYRNRYKSLKKEGLSDKDAEAQAFQDFREIAEESQQSSRPDRISKQQAGPLGRVVLAFANTPAQYARLMQKAASDLKNRRGDDKTNISKILYYGAIQNVIFNALQQALFAMAFSDEEPDEEKLNKKYTGIINGMADSLLRGIGFHGAAISTLKNVIMKLASGAKAQDAAIEMLDISPPISSKIGKLKSAGRTWDWNKKEIMQKGWSLDNPAWLASGQVVSAATNVPLDRGIRKLQNLREASNTENEEWMRVANALGWAKWELEWQKDKNKKGPITRKEQSRTEVKRSEIERIEIERN